MSSRPRVSASQRRARLADRHRLTPDRHTDDLASIADAVVALHATDPATVYLSAMARMQHPSTEAVSTALYDDHSVVRHHAMRRTLFVFTPEVARVAHAAATEALIARQRKLLVDVIEASGVARDGARWLRRATADTLAALDELGPSPARRLGQAVPALRAPLHLAPGKTYAATVSAHTRILLLLGFEGVLVRTKPTGSWVSGEYTWARMETWLPGGVTGMERSEAERELARRWLHAFGPGTAADLQWWTGWTATATKRALAATNALEVDLDDGATGWMLADDLDGLLTTPERKDERWIAFLPGLDPTIMGWKERHWYLPPTHVSSLFDRNGNGGPTIWVDGEVVGGWVQRKDGEIAYRLLTEVSKARQRGIDAAAKKVRELIGDARVTVRFPAPIQAALL